MANQSSNYKKFAVAAASAALVASIVTPMVGVANFSDTQGNIHEVAFNALSKAGAIKGYEDGSFRPNKTLTRSDAVKLMGKWLVAEGNEIPQDARTNPRFSDLKTTSNGDLLDYAAVVKDNNVFNGSRGKLLAADDITREDMAIVIVRALDQVHNVDLVSYVASQDFARDVKDLAKAKAGARPSIDVFDYFDITDPNVTNFNPKSVTTRGHFATFLYKSVSDNIDFSAVKDDVSKNENSQNTVIGDGNKDIADDIRIKLTFNNEEVIVKMHDNPTSKDFLETLPLTLKLEDHAGTEKISVLAKRLSLEDAPSGIDPSVGDFTYYSPWGNLAIFYEDFGYSNGLVKLGTIESGIESLASIRGDFTVTIKKID